jgi:hypothetical protein
MLQASMNEQHQAALEKVSKYLRDLQCPDLLAEENAELRRAFRLLLNHYEFMAAGLRNGDFDERLVRDSERGTVVSLCESCKVYIYQLRDKRSRQAIYEHIEWLHQRWKTRQPGRMQRMLERSIGRPLPSRRTVIDE